MKAHRLGGDMKDDTRIALLEQSISHINETMTRLEIKMDRLDSKLEDGFKGVNGRIWANFYWGVAGFSSVLGLIAHALRWI